MPQYVYHAAQEDNIDKVFQVDLINHQYFLISHSAEAINIMKINTEVIVNATFTYRSAYSMSLRLFTVTLKLSRLHILSVGRSYGVDRQTDIQCESKK